jgi:hypothetical protein
VVDTDITVLSSGCVTLAGGVYGDVVERSEVTSHSANLLFEDLVVESGFEFTLAGRCGGDIHGGLTTTEDDEILLCRHRSRVKWGIGNVGLEYLEITGVDNLSAVSCGCLVN